MRTAGLIVSLLFLTARLGNSAESATLDWSMNASMIEACSCPMFCQCYFNAQPAAHGGHAGHSQGEGGEHFCKFNNDFKINQGSYSNTKTNSVKLWVASNIDGHFSKGSQFLIMKNEVEAYSTGHKPFEFKGTNGFMITIVNNSKDAVTEKPGPK